ncbi:acyltransferase [Brevundimonas sp. 2R-24]|uniref:Acyltransferase n=1 Tax=Peiella sedimenti TaxID=3061083 RepID=A0ABT8SLE2_9CAUL|nr:acyltransferase [Caulobacteraceae bacterium XZ-24]
MTETTAATQPRFLALDALRGVLALLVVLFHLPVDSHLRDLPLVMHGYLAVDYFFVLSGFVIAHSYGQRINGLAQGRDFLIKRVARVWPLHAVMLGLFVLLEVVRALTHFDPVPPFTGDRAPGGIVTNLLMIHALGTEDSQTWNGPAWAVSAEMLCYVVFAGIMLWARRFGIALSLILSLILAVLGAVIVVSLAPRWMNTTWEYGWARALYGFFLGLIVYRVFSWRRAPGKGWLEALLILAALAFIWVATGPWTVLASLVFAPVIWVLAGDRGPVARALTWKPLVKLGDVSYGVYLIHMLLIVLMLIAARKLGLFHERRVDLGSMWLNDLLTLGFLALVIALAVASYRYIETPARDAVGAWLRRRSGVSSAHG